MKKIISAILVLLLLFSFAGCKKENKSTAKTGVDIAYYANLGSMPESNLKLGDNVPEDKEDETYFFSEDGTLDYFSNCNFSYYYSPKDEPQKITAIAAFSEAFGFGNGDVSIEITDTLDLLGIKYTEREPQENELFFLPAGDFTVIECKDLKNNLIFVFTDNSFCAALLSEK